MKIKPLFDNVLLEPIETKTTNNGILLPNTIADKPSLAMVIAISENPSEEIIIKVNDVVLFNKFAGSEFKLDGKSYILIKQTDILAIIK